MTQIEELIYKFGMDTEDSERGADRIEKAFERIGKAQKKADGGSGGGGSQHGGGNLAWAAHDLLTGRVTSAMFRFSSAMKMGTGAAIAMNGALEIGGKAFDYMAGRMNESQSAALRLEQSFIRLSKAATYSSSSDDPGKLSGMRENLYDQIQDEKHAQGEDERLQDILKSKGGWLWRQYAQYKELETGQSVEDRINTSKAHQTILGKEQAKASRDYRESLGDSAEMAYDRVHGSPFKAQRTENARRVEVEVKASQAAGGTKDDEKLIRQRYDLQKQAIDRDERVAVNRLATEGKIAVMRQGGADAEMDGAKERLEDARKALNDPVTKGDFNNSFAKKTAQNNVDSAQAEVNRLEQSRAQEGISARGETAALRLQTVGRDDQAQIVNSRAQSEAAISDAKFNKRDDKVGWLTDQQEERERQFRVHKYLNEDGTMRNPGAVQAEETAARRKSMRISQFLDGTPDTDAGGGMHTLGLDGGPGGQTAAAKALARADSRFKGTGLSGRATKVGDMGLGLMSVVKGMDGNVLSAKDSLTGQTLNAHQIADRAQEAKAHNEARQKAQKENAKDDRSDREIQQEIFKVLNSRLPATTK